jgi:26S proteasome regulatory subunit N9
LQGLGDLICFLVDLDRLWYQLTLKLFEFFNHPLSQPYKVYVFETFVRDFEAKLNQLKLVQMAVNVVKAIDSTFSFLMYPSYR